MTLDKALRMTPQEFEEACRLAAPRPPNKALQKRMVAAGVRELEQILKDFADFKSTPDSIMAIRNAGQHTL
jgi:hypothetical protein